MLNLVDFHVDMDTFMRGAVDDSKDSILVVMHYYMVVSSFGSE